LDLNGKQEQLQEQGTESIQEKQARIFLLTYQQQWAKTKGNPRTGGRICTPPPPPPLTRRRGETREQQRDYGAARRGVEEDPGQHQPSEGGTGTGRAASCPAVLVLEFLEACAVRVRARRGAVGGSIAATFRRSVAPTPAAPAPAAAHLTCFACKRSRRHVHASLLPQHYCRLPRLSDRARELASRSAAVNLK
jgi:hypothetical protein